ncbi:MAG TPA: gliding motility-associated C-terminal domain-containing protein, partial [Flavobacteriales bacterium]|nr:gliding motility-associated C-terminal domain-containing protein [Flavobacteriales bacterium]
GNGWDEILYFAPNGCVDTIGIWVGFTRLDVDTLFFCAGDAAFQLNEETTGRRPWDGDWSGASIQQNGDGDWFFRPQQAGIGVHLLTYDANTCSDALLAIIHPAQLPNDLLTVCASIDPFYLANVPPGANFTGAGVDDAGLFDPAVAGSGVHMIQYTTPGGCRDSVEVTVIPFLQATISGVQQRYCSNEVEVTISLAPEGGVFQGLGTTIFNPSTLPDGDYTLVYTYGSGNCQSSDTVRFSDHPALHAELVASNNPICTGGGTAIVATAEGGDPQGLLVFQWDNGLFPAATVSVSPTTSTTYTVFINDGCSDPVTETIDIVVHPPFEPQFTFSAMQCFGEPGYVNGGVDAPGTYVFHWSTGSEEFVADSIVLPAGGLAMATVTNQETGCQSDSLIRIPSWPVITALYSSNPNETCIPYEQREVTFIDLSNNAVGGHWVINADTIPYEPGVNPTYDHGVAGSYRTQLVVWNEGFCADSMAIDICIRDSEVVFIPDVFSPNGDGNNDVLYVRGPTVVEMEFAVYDRWGSRLFASGSVDQGWDGTANGDRSASGVYVYTLFARAEDGTRIERTGNITLVR